MTLTYRFELKEAALAAASHSEFVFEPPDQIIVTTTRPHVMPAEPGRGATAWSLAHAVKG